MFKASDIRALATLYAGRVAGAAAGFAFLPLYNKALGDEAFGVVAVILSLQAMALMLDLGLSAYTARDIADPGEDRAALQILLGSAELALTLIYAGVAACVILVKMFGLLDGLGFSEITGIVLILWMAVLQNLYFVAALAAGRYESASIVQAVSVVFRGVGTALILSSVSATIGAFIACQVVGGLMHVMAARWVSYAGISHNAAKVGWSRVGWRGVKNVLKRGRALGVSFAAGAAVMHLDKPIITLFVSAPAVSPYFLATTLCLTPLSLLVSPVSQYFQPMTTRHVATSPEMARKTVDKYVFGLFALGVLPVLALWVFRESIVSFWLGAGASAGLVSGYSKFLLPGVMVGVFAYVAQTLLMAVRDFTFLAIQSGTLAIVTLAAVLVAAGFESVTSICIISATYYVVATIVLWIRAASLPRVRDLARRASRQCLLMILLAAAVGVSLDAVLN